MSIDDAATGPEDVEMKDVSGHGIVTERMDVA
jgi:hypothetical protein